MRSNDICVKVLLDNTRDKFVEGVCEMDLNKKPVLNESKARLELVPDDDDAAVVESKAHANQSVAISGVSHNVQISTNQIISVDVLCRLALESYQHVLLIENANREGRMIAFNKQEENLNEEKN